MPLFETKIPVDSEQISALVLKNWGFKLGNVIKASQNHTFEATNEDGTKFAVRVTPDPDKKHLQRIKDQLTFVKYCCDHKLNHLCEPIKPQTSEDGSLIVTEGDLIVAAFEWAHGAPVNYFELTWMKDEALIMAWGRFFAELHKISRQFSKQNEEVAKRIQNWNQIHHGVLSKIQLHPEDQADVDNPEYFGVIHGDLNTSNQYFDREANHLSVYDTDQTQRGFYEWDVSQAIFGVVVLKQAGMPISGDPVPQADPEAFTELMIKGYESFAGEGKINKARLTRMIDMKRQFYRLFCTQAIEEGDIPKDMEPFIQFIAKAFKKP